MIYFRYAEQRHKKTKEEAGQYQVLFLRDNCNIIVHPFISTDLEMILSAEQTIASPNPYAHPIGIAL